MLDTKWLVNEKRIKEMVTIPRELIQVLLDVVKAVQTMEQQILELKKSDGFYATTIHEIELRNEEMFETLKVLDNKCQCDKITTKPKTKKSGKKHA